MLFEFQPRWVHSLPWYLRFLKAVAENRNRLWQWPDHLQSFEPLCLTWSASIPKPKARTLRNRVKNVLYSTGVCMMLLPWCLTCGLQACCSGHIFFVVVLAPCSFKPEAFLARWLRGPGHWNSLSNAMWYLDLFVQFCHFTALFSQIHVSTESHWKDRYMFVHWSIVVGPWFFVGIVDTKTQCSLTWDCDCFDFSILQVSLGLEGQVVWWPQESNKNRGYKTVGEGIQLDSFRSPTNWRADVIFLLVYMKGTKLNLTCFLLCEGWWTNTTEIPLKHERHDLDCRHPVIWKHSSISKQHQNHDHHQINSHWQNQHHHHQHHHNNNNHKQDFSITPHQSQITK